MINNFEGDLMQTNHVSNQHAGNILSLIKLKNLGRLCLAFFICAFLSSCATNQVNEQERSLSTCQDAEISKMNKNDLQLCFKQLSDQLIRQNLQLESLMPKNDIFNFKRQKRNNIEKLIRRMKPWHTFYNNINTINFDTIINTVIDCSARNLSACMHQASINQTLKLGINAAQRQTHMIQKILYKEPLQLCHGSTSLPFLVPIKESKASAVINTIKQLNLDIQQVEEEILGCQTVRIIPKTRLMPLPTSNVIKLTQENTLNKLIWCKDGDVTYTPSRPTHGVSLTVGQCIDGIRKIEFKKVTATIRPLMLWVNDDYYEVWVD